MLRRPMGCASLVGDVPPGALTRDKTDPIGVASMTCRTPGAWSRQASPYCSAREANGGGDSTIAGSRRSPMQQGQVERAIYVAVDAGEVAHFGVECTGTYGTGAAQVPLA